jgi:hypothetical protein
MLNKACMSMMELGIGYEFSPTINLYMKEAINAVIAEAEAACIILMVSYILVWRITPTKDLNTKKKVK